MPRFFVLLVMTLMMSLVYLPTAEATHEWGHRYMIFGRIIDSEGEPAQMLPVRITVETTKPSDPWMIVQTDCHGLYYSLERTGDPSRGGGLELGRMHIHNAELPSDGKYTVSTDLGEKTGTVRAQLKYSTVNLQLDEPAPKSDQCGDAGGWENQFVVAGHAQEDRGNERRDIQTVRNPDYDINNTEEVTVTIETSNGPVSQTQEINMLGDYWVIFDNVTVQEGDRVTVAWEDEVKESTVSENDLKYRVAEVNMVVKDSISTTAIMVILGIVVVAAVVGAGVYGFTKYRESRETKRLMESGARKRANR